MWLINTTHCYEESSNLSLNKSSNGNSEDLFKPSLQSNISNLAISIMVSGEVIYNYNEKKQIKLCSDQNTKVIWKLFKETLK